MNFLVFDAKLKPIAILQVGARIATDPTTKEELPAVELIVRGLSIDRTMDEKPFEIETVNGPQLNGNLSTITIRLGNKDHFLTQVSDDDLRNAIKLRGVNPIGRA